MIIAKEILDPALLAHNPPENCPTLNIREDLDFAQGHDTVGGYNETPDFKGVTCVPVRYASNAEIIHPACESCRVANTVVFDMKEYRIRLGFKS